MFANATAVSISPPPDGDCVFHIATCVVTFFSGSITSHSTSYNLSTDKYKFRRHTK